MTAPETRSAWQIEQGKKCGRRGSDEYCPCQNTNSTTPARAEAQDEGAAGETVEWLGGGNYEPTKAMIEAGLDHNHRHNSEANMVASFKSMMVQAEIDGLINPAHPSPTPAADADRVRIAVEALEVKINAPLTGPTHGAWDRGRIAGLKEAIAALKSTAAKEGGAL